MSSLTVRESATGIFTIEEAAEKIASAIGDAIGNANYCEQDLRRLLFRELRWCQGSMKNLIPTKHSKKQRLLSDTLVPGGLKGCYITPTGIETIKRYYHNKWQKENGNNSRKPNCYRIKNSRR